MMHFRLFEKVITFILLAPLMLRLIKKNKGNAIKVVYILLFWVYIVSFIGLVFFPIITGMKIKNFKPAINLIPFNTIQEMWGYGFSKFFKQIIGNILLFAPMGALVPLLFEKFNKWKKIILLGLCISFSVELIQLSMDLISKYNIKVCDVDDVILNVIGIIIGFIFKIILIKFIPNRYEGNKKLLRI